jgi:RimJ/RimL family protein N-acetyltransferase
MRFPDRFPVLTTERLVLREATDHDVEPTFAMQTDPEVMRYWSSLPMHEITEARATVEQSKEYFIERTALRWVITLHGDDAMIGTASLFHLSEQNGRAEIGYALARAYWGKGYMREALTAVVDYAFGPFGLRRLEADIDPRNLRSVHALEQLGFVREGLLRERWQVGDEISDTAFMGLLAREWTARRAAG